jgi:protein NrfC
MTCQECTRISRRDFIRVTGAIIMVVGMSGCKAGGAEESPTPAATKTPTQAPSVTPKPVATVTATPEVAETLITVGEIPPANGYLLVDVGKCQGCLSCMLACSLVQEGVESLSLSRIQIMQNSFAPFPHDLTVEACRQCVDPACVAECPVGALTVDAEHGNVRLVREEECIGCGLCYQACPFTPSRAFLAADQDYDGEPKSRKCDLCADAPHHWGPAGGGPDGEQACVAVCPVGAIAFSKEIPVQEGDEGYKVNLRSESWALLGYPTS